MKRERIGRNDPCWCNSGKKYKLCHERRAEQSRPTLQEIGTTIRASYSKKYCLHPQSSPATCSGQIVRAHTVQKSRGLKFLARDGYVYGFNADFPTLNKTNGMPDVRRIGISNASTFTGFCGFHDNQTFEPIEKYPFQSNQQHTFLLGYRAICKEVFQKKAEVELLSFRRSLDRGKSIEGQIWFQQFVDDWETGLISGLKDVEYYKSTYDKSLLSDDFSEVRYCVFRLHATPDFLCSGAAYAESDFEGNSLQKFQDPDTLLEPITFSIIATDTGGAVVFSWLGNSSVNSKLMRSIDSLPEDQIPHAIARFTFEYFENVFMAPGWWESLSESAKQIIFRRVATEAHPNLPRTNACLIDDGLRIVNWSIDSRENSLY